jgi:hypothetical protein
MTVEIHSRLISDSGNLHIHILSLILISLNPHVYLCRFKKGIVNRDPESGLIVAKERLILIPAVASLSCEFVLR